MAWRRGLCVCVWVEAEMEEGGEGGTTDRQQGEGQRQSVGGGGLCDQECQLRATGRVSGAQLDQQHAGTLSGGQLTELAPM